MAFEDLYAALNTNREAIDLREREGIPHEPDEVVYRLGYSSVPIAGMPDECRIGRVAIFRTLGPVFTQHTLLRQRHGYPIVFDKAMSLNVEVGRNEVLTICQIREPAPSDAAASFSAWREEASSALGIVAAMLDERVAVDERFEDAIAMKKGQPLSSADARTRLRTFLPFDVTDEERKALRELAELQTAELTPLAEAARWYLRGAQEGPAADAIVYFWIAIEALTPHRTTSPKTVEAMLVSAGFDPDTFGEPNLGRLAGLRADIVHSGSRNHPLIETGYYRLETVVRVLIRAAAGISSSWTPVLTAAVFGDRADEVRQSQIERKTVWHDGGLPPPGEPEAAGFEWDRVQARMAPGLPPMQVSYSGELQPGWRERVGHWLARAAEFLEIDFEPIQIDVTSSPSVVPAHVQMAASREGILIRPDLLCLPDPLREVNLARHIQEGLAQVAVMRLGIASIGFGTTLIAAGGSWAMFRAFYGPDGPFAGDDLKMKEIGANDLNGIGMALGAATAGSSVAVRALANAAPDDESEFGQLIATLLSEWMGLETFSQILAGIETVAGEFKSQSDEFPS